MITPLPVPAPSPTDTPEEFNSHGFILLGALPQFVDETNDTATQVNANAATAVTAANTATTKAAAAAGSATAAEGSATTATSKAATATTKAAEASASAADALASKNSAAASAAAALGQIFAAGVRLLFHQAAAPTGWYQDTSDIASNRMLRVVNGGGGGGGGYHDPTYNNVVPYHTHGFSTGGVSSDHTHGVNDPGHNHSTAWGNGGELFLQNSGQVSNGGATGYSGTGIYLSGANANHTHSGGTDGGSSQTVWEPRYTNLIICVKA